MDRIAVSEAVDAGSIPARRILFDYFKPLLLKIPH